MRRYNNIIKRKFEKQALPGKLVSPIIQFKCFANQNGYLPFDGLDIGQIPQTPESRLSLKLGVIRCSI